MTPFQRFRLWLRRAPAGERAAAALAVLLVVAVLLWIVVSEGEAAGAENDLLDPNLNRSHS